MLEYNNVPEEEIRKTQGAKAKNYFNSAINENEQFRESDPDSDKTVYDNEGFILAEAQKQFEKLYGVAYKNNRPTASGMAYGLNRLGMDMVVQSMRTGDAAADTENQKGFDVARDLFMEASKQVYGEARVGLERSYLQSFLNRAEKANLRISQASKDALLKTADRKKYAELTDQLTDLIREFSSQGRDMAHDAIAKPKEDPKDLEVLASMNQLRYELQSLQELVDKKAALFAPTQPTASSVERQQEKMREQEKTKEALSQVRKEIGIESQEQELNKEKLVKSILEDGGFRAHTALSKEVSGLDHQGFYSLESRIDDNRYPSTAIGEAAQRLLTRSDRGRFSENIQGVREVLAEHGISEMLDVQKEQAQEYEQVIISGKKGILGFGATADRTEQKPTGRYRSLLHSELVQGGKSEPAVRFSYIVSGRNREWRSSDGRGGQMLSLEVVLPESVAKEFEAAAERDPKLVRDIVEKIMKEKILKKPEEWDKPQFKGGGGDDGTTTIRPPYEQWDKAYGGARVYIQKAGKEPGFHQEFVHEIK